MPTVKGLFPTYKRVVLVFFFFTHLWNYVRGRILLIHGKLNDTYQGEKEVMDTNGFEIWRTR